MNIAELSEDGVLPLGSKHEIVEKAPCDLIVLSHVLEHEPSPLQLLKFLSGQLSANGLLYVELPIEYCGSIVKKKGIALGPHVNFFTRRSLLACIYSVKSLAPVFVAREFSPYGELQMPVIKILAK